MRVVYVATMLLLSLGIVLAGGTGTPRKEDVPKYLKMLLKSQSAKDRALGAEMLGRRGAVRSADVKDAIEPLQKALEKDVDSAVRAAAAKALGNIGVDAENTVPLLIKALKDKGANVPLAAINALSQYGPDAKDALPELRQFLGKKDDKVSSLAAKLAIGNITGKGKK